MALDVIGRLVSYFRGFSLAASRKDSEAHADSSPDYDPEPDSLIIVDEIDLEPPPPPVLPQYGTSLAHSTPISTTSELRLTTVVHKESAVPFDYDSRVRKFYLPHIPHDYRTYDEDVTPDKYKLSVDEKLEEVEAERKSRESRIALSDADRRRVDAILHSRSSTALVSNYQIDITLRDLKTLGDRCWLNDNVIDYYFNLISAQDERYFSWTSHFYTTLSEKGYNGVKRWSKRRKLDMFTKSMIFIPININSTHWALAIINNEAHTIEYYDSLNMSGNMRAVTKIREWIAGEIDRLGSSARINDYQLLPNQTAPQQSNGYDCGVFTCICANFLSRNKPLTYSQNDMKILRRRMILEIIDNKLM